jgi:hypothetical protein
MLVRRKKYVWTSIWRTSARRRLNSLVDPLVRRIESAGMTDHAHEPRVALRRGNGLQRVRPGLSARGIST